MPFYVDREYRETCQAWIHYPKLYGFAASMLQGYIKLILWVNRPIKMLRFIIRRYFSENSASTAGIA